MKVYVVLEIPDMSEYGNPEIHGVYSTREAALAKIRTLIAGYSAIYIEEFEVQS
jgi:hypothetical protein